MELAGRVVLVTGASAGIGAAVAQRCADAGARVLVHGRDPERTGAVAEQAGGTPLLADLAEPAAAGRLAAAAQAVHGHVDVAVLNAGLGWSGPYDAMPAEVLEQVLAVDLAAPLRLVHALLPRMLARGVGHVVLVGSVAGRTGVAGEAAYAAAKAGLDAFAESLGQELAGSGVSVSLVLPGAVDTGFFDGRGRDYGRRVPAPVPVGRVADAVLASIACGRSETWVPGWLRTAAVVRALAPRAYRRLSLRFGEDVRSGAHGRSS
ncbi:MAG: SDR family NAD(P)-dependent oxidoreductase [Marmoricola sp.]